MWVLCPVLGPMRRHTTSVETTSTPSRSSCIALPAITLSLLQPTQRHQPAGAPSYMLDVIASVGCGETVRLGPQSLVGKRTAGQEVT